MNDNIAFHVYIYFLLLLIFNSKQSLAPVCYLFNRGTMKCYMSTVLFIRQLSNHIICESCLYKTVDSPGCVSWTCDDLIVINKTTAGQVTYKQNTKSDLFLQVRDRESSMLLDGWKMVWQWLDNDLGWFQIVGKMLLLCTLNSQSCGLNIVEHSS